MYKSDVLVFFILFIIPLPFNYVFTTETANVELVDDKLLVSIPNDPDIQWVSFNVNINKEFESLEAGQQNKIVPKSEGPRIFAEFTRSLADTDYIYIKLIINKKGNIKITSTQGPILVEHKRKHVEPITATTVIKQKGNNNITSIQDPILVEHKRKHVEPITATTTEAPLPSSTMSQCLPSITEVTFGDNKHCQNDLIFEETFKNFDTERWTNEVRLPLDSTDFEFVLYNGTSYVDNNILKIPATAYEGNITSGTIELGHRCTSTHLECSLTADNLWYLPPIVSGRINSEKSFNFKYGRIEVKAKIPKGDWLVPLILLQPTDKQYGRYDKSGEIRIAFGRGNSELTWKDTNIDGRRLFGGVVLTKDADQRHQFMQNVTLSEVNGSEDEHFGNKFHVYSVNWNKTDLELFVDKYSYGTIRNDFLDQMFYITLGLSAAGHGDFPNNLIDKPWMNTCPKAWKEFNKKREDWLKTWTQPVLEVDYVKVYAV